MILIGDSDKKLSGFSTTNTVTLASGPVTKYSANREPRQRVADFGERRPRQITGEPRQPSVAVFGDRDKFQNEGRPVSATATKKCRPLRRPLQKSVADFGDRDRFQSEGRPVSATATIKSRPLRRRRLLEMRRKRANFVAEVGEGDSGYACDLYLFITYTKFVT